jgi:protein ImuA
MLREESSIPVVRLREWLERAQGAPAQASVLPFGLEPIDRHLLGGGLTLGRLHEFMEGGAETEYAAAATLFVAGIAARLKGPVLWCLHGHDLFAPALSRVGLHPDRVIYCETRTDADALAAMETGLRHAGLAAVIGEIAKLPLNASRRLHLAAEQHRVTALVLRRWHTRAQRALADQPSSAVTRWRISPCAGEDGRFERLPRARWQLDLLRARGSDPHSWIVEACDAQGRLALPAAVANRPVAAEERRAATG